MVNKGGDMGSESLFVKCKSCGKDISAKASICPSCGVKQKKLKPLHWVGIVFGVLTFIGILNSPDDKNSANQSPTSSSSQIKSTSTKTSVPAINKPGIQSQLEGVVTKYISQYKQAKNELQKSSLRSKRRGDIAATVTNFQIQNWVGTISELSTNSEGKAILSIRINPNIEIKTWNNALSDIASNTLIDQNSDLYNQLIELAVGQQIYFSGYFLNGDEDYLQETSMTEEGAMVNPEFLMKFTNVSTIN